MTAIEFDNLKKGDFVYFVSSPLNSIGLYKVTDKTDSQVLIELNATNYVKIPFKQVYTTEEEAQQALIDIVKKRIKDNVNRIKKDMGIINAISKYAFSHDDLIHIENQIREKFSKLEE